MEPAKFLRFSYFNLGFHKLNPRKYIPRIESELNLGTPKSKIFENLSGETEEKEELAFLINSLTSGEKKLQKKSKNILLMILVSFNILLYLVSFLSMAHVQSLVWIFVIIFLLAQIRKYRARAYFFVMVYSVINILFLFFESQTMIVEMADLIFVTFFVIYYLLLMYIAYQIKRELYPNYTYLGPRVDDQGGFIFTD